MQLLPGANASNLFAKTSGVYNLIVTDANTCEDSATTGIAITNNPLPVVSITPSGNTAFCDGDSAEIVTSNTGTFQWTRNGLAIAGATASNLFVKTSGVYNLIVTDANTCEDSAASGITMTNNPLPVVSITPSGNTDFCTGDSAELTTSNTGTLQWMRNGTAIVGATNTNLFVKSSGNYNLTVTDGNMCVDTAASGIAMTENPLPVVTITNQGQDTLCDGDTTFLMASAGLFYQWFNNGIPILPTTALISVSSSGNYNVIVQDGNTCTDSAATATSTNCK